MSSRAGDEAERAAVEEAITRYADLLTRNLSTEHLAMVARLLAAEKERLPSPADETRPHRR
jgi:hypothetical protein